MRTEKQLRERYEDWKETNPRSETDVDMTSEERLELATDTLEYLDTEGGTIIERLVELTGKESLVTEVIDYFRTRLQNEISTLETELQIG